MAIRIIREDGDDILRKLSKPVTEINEAVLKLINDMKETMEAKGGCGIAAVQVGVLRRILICRPDEKNPKEMYTFINPEVTWESEEKEEDYEGCLSIPGMSGEVERPVKIHVKAVDENNKIIDRDYDDFFARIILHEMDHLNGILYKDRCPKGLLTNEELEELMKEEKKKQ